MILDDIKSKLQELDPNVHYGLVHDPENVKLWDYIVFRRQKVKDNENRNAYSYYYTVWVFREGYIPEDLDRQVIAKMCEIPGMKKATEDGTYDYLYKGNTDVVVEVLQLTFVRAKK